MAQKIIVSLIDDLDGSAADETLAFTFEGSSYVIDLNAENAADFKTVMEKYTSVARREGRQKGASTPAVTRTGPSPKDVRAWAKSAGVEVTERGRIKQEVVDQYLAAH